MNENLAGITSPDQRGGHENNGNEAVFYNLQSSTLTTGYSQHIKSPVDRAE